MEVWTRCLLKSTDGGSCKLLPEAADEGVQLELSKRNLEMKVTGDVVGGDYRWRCGLQLA